MRDAAYRRRSIAFLQQASRYRGKANYRDAIFLAYGKTVAPRLDGLVDDLPVVLEGFTAMAEGYCSLRIGKANWGPFLQDLEENRSLPMRSYKRRVGKEGVSTCNYRWTTCN